MDETEILKLLEQISSNLDSTETSLKENDWDTVSLLLTQINILQQKIKNSPVPVEVLRAKNPAFDEAYEPLKNVVMEKTKLIMTRIEEWKADQVKKIGGAHTVRDNISKYNTQNKTSFYFDRSE